MYSLELKAPRKMFGMSFMLSSNCGLEEGKVTAVGRVGVVRCLFVPSLCHSVTASERRALRWINAVNHADRARARAHLLNLDDMRNCRDHEERAISRQPPSIELS